MHVTLDIETMPNESMAHMLPEPEIDIRLKDPEKIEVARAKAMDKAASEMALSPWYGRVASCVIAVSDQGGTTYKRWCVSDDKDSTERFVVTSALWEIGRRDVVTFNGFSFDLPFLWSRAIKLGVKPEYPLSKYMRRYSVAPHCDMRMVLTNWNSYAKNSTLDAFAQLLLSESKDPMGFDEIPELIKTEGGRQKLLDYNQRDVDLTERLYMRCKGVLF